MSTPHPNVRVMCRPAAPPSCDLCLEERVAGQWVERWRTNDMSNDNAHTDMAARAHALASAWASTDQGRG
jgi:hypothetical protein